VRSARFPRRHRLLNAADYARVFREAERSQDRYFTVLTSPNTLTHPRLGLAISKKTDKRAVIRNRIKRQVRESFRIRAMANADYVVLSRPPAAGQPGHVLRRSLEKHWQNLDHPSGARNDG